MYKLFYIHRNFLKEHMVKHGIKVVDLVEKCGLSKSTIDQVRHHHQEPMKYTMETLSEALEVDVAVLFPRKEVIGRSKPHSGKKYVKLSEREEVV